MTAFVSQLDNLKKEWLVGEAFLWIGVEEDRGMIRLDGSKVCNGGFRVCQPPRNVGHSSIQPPFDCSTTLSSFGPSKFVTPSSTASNSNKSTFR